MHGATFARPLPQRLAPLAGMGAGKGLAGQAGDLVVPFPAGGGTDAFARPLSAQFPAHRQATLVIDNRRRCRRHGGRRSRPKAAGPTATRCSWAAVHHAIAPSDVPQAGLRHRERLRAAGLVANVPQVLVVNPKRVPGRLQGVSWTWCARTRASSTTARPAAAPRTTWRASCSSSRPDLHHPHPLPWRRPGAAGPDCRQRGHDVRRPGLVGRAHQGRAHQGTDGGGRKRNPAFPDVPCAAELGLPDYT
jgi:hypothetical protein